MIKSKTVHMHSCVAEDRAEPTLLPPYFQPLTLSIDKNEVSEKVPRPS